MVDASYVLETGLIVALIAMGIVFIVLILYKGIFKLIHSTKNNEVPEVTLVPTVVQQEDNDEIVAVIAAAIAASMNTSTYNLRVASIRRIDDNSPAWNKVGRQQVIDSRF